MRAALLADDGVLALPCRLQHHLKTAWSRTVHFSFALSESQCCLPPPDIEQS
jgi:hypothetical protein